MTLDASCTPVQATTRVTITFTGLSGDGSPFTTYTQSGVTVVPTQGSWQISTGYGSPAPFIQFETPAASPAHDSDGDGDRGRLRLHVQFG